MERTPIPPQPRLLPPPPVSLVTCLQPVWLSYGLPLLGTPRSTRRISGHAVWSRREQNIKSEKIRTVKLQKTHDQNKQETKVVITRSHQIPVRGHAFGRIKQQHTYICIRTRTDTQERKKTQQKSRTKTRTKNTNEQNNKTSIVQRRVETK